MFDEEDPAWVDNTFEMEIISNEPRLTSPESIPP